VLLNCHTKWLVETEVKSAVLGIAYGASKGLRWQGPLCWIGKRRVAFWRTMRRGRCQSPWWSGGELKGAWSVAKAEINGAFEIPKHSFSCGSVSGCGAVHMLTQLVDGVGDVWMSESGVLESSKDLAEFRWIGKGVSIKLGHFGAGCAWGAVRLGVKHAGTDEDVLDVLGLP